jgi:uncharacterized protein
MSPSSLDAAMISALTAQEWRDLLWLAEGPDLMELTPPCPLVPLSPEPVGSQRESSDASSTHRVGAYVERLVRCWLELTPGVTAIGQGILLSEGKRTMGELDFLFTHQGSRHHLEVALKFYLHHPHPAGPSLADMSHFPGPNATDNFEKKRDRLVTHQLPLGRANFPEIETSRALVKGTVFYRPGEEPPALLPAAMNPAHRRGIWIRADEISRLVEEPWARNSRGIIMTKPRWLSGWSSDGAEAAKPIAELHRTLQVHFADSRTTDRPVLLSLAHEGATQESARVFVVPAHWPARPG